MIFLIEPELSLHTNLLGWGTKNIQVFPFDQYHYNLNPYVYATNGLTPKGLIEKIYGDIKYEHLISFFDNMCIYSNGSFEDHLSKIEDVLVRLREFGLTVNLDKFTFVLNSILFLVHVFKNQPVPLHPDRVRHSRTTLPLKTATSKPLDF